MGIQHLVRDFGVYTVGSRVWACRLSSGVGV